MIIESNNTIYEYEGSEALDLFTAPSPDSDKRLYDDYNYFINAVDAIYGTQDLNGNIPIFRTKEDVLSDNLLPDTDSTLRFLVPGQSYLFIIKSDAYLPLSLPSPLGLKEFIAELSIQENYTKNCCPILTVQNEIVKLNKNSGSSYIIKANILDMLSNEQYFYEIKPIFSNWPAKLTPLSGEVIIPKSPDPQSGKVSGYIESSFVFYPYLTDNIVDSIPYEINKSNNNLLYNKNIYSVVNLSIYNDKCIIYDKNITISCDQCVNNAPCPDITLNSAGSGYTKYISVKVDNLQYNTQYRYEFTTDSSNAAANMYPISGILDHGTDQTSSTLYSVFKYCDFADETADLQPTTNSYNDPLITNNLYTNLIFNLYSMNNNYCSGISNNLLVECDQCFESNKFKTSVNFAPPEYNSDGTNTVNYPNVLVGDIAFLTVNNLKISRPVSEYNLVNVSGILAIPCCNKPAILKLDISNAIPGDRYTYDFTSYPSITIVPTTGLISCGDTSNSFSVLAYLEGNKSSSVHVTLTHEKSNQKTSGSTIVRCPATGIS